MLEIINEIVLISMILLAFLVIEEKVMISAVIKYALMGLMLVFALFYLKAPDVALSAIVVGALVIGLFVYTIEEVSS